MCLGVNRIQFRMRLNAVKLANNANPQLSVPGVLGAYCIQFVLDAESDFTLSGSENATGFCIHDI